jgi:hypothetical protein
LLLKGFVVVEKIGFEYRQVNFLVLNFVGLKIRQYEKQLTHTF